MPIPRRTGVITAIAAAVAVSLLVANVDRDAASADDDFTVSIDAPTSERIRSEAAFDESFSLPDGSYEMVGYGTVLVAEGSEITPLYVTSSTCATGDPFDNELDVDHADDDGDQIVIDLIGPTTDYRLRPLVEVPICDSDSADSLTAVDEVFARHYPFFEVRGVDWDISMALLRDAVDRDGASVAEALGGFMLALGDGHTLLPHLDVDIDTASFGVDGVDDVPDLAALIDAESDATLERLDALNVGETGNVAWGRLATDSDIGYLYIGAFESSDEARADRDALARSLDGAFAELESADHLIVDMRFNNGGSEDLATIAAGYFVEKPTAAYRKWAFAEPDPLVQTITIEPQNGHFDGPVTVLTSPITASAAEIFVLSMREVASATIIGSPSFGEFSDAIDWTLPDGTEFTMSMEVYTDLAGANFEAIGIPLDERVAFDRALDIAVARASSPPAS